MADESIGDRQTVLAIVVPDSVPDDDIVEAIKNTVLAMDSYHRALGGSGLKLAHVEVMEVSDE